MQALGVSGTASITANEDPGDGNGQLDAGDGANLSIQLKNSDVVNATMVSATLTTSTAGITVHTPNVSAYPDLAALGGSGSNTTLYRFTIASNVTCPTTICFTLTATFTGGGSPQVLPVHCAVAPRESVRHFSISGLVVGDAATTHCWGRSAGCTCCVQWSHDTQAESSHPA